MSTTTLLRFLLLGGWLASVASPRAAVAADGQPAALNPCALVDKTDVFRLLGWTVDEISKRPYRLQENTGKMCFLHSAQGEVIVTVPDAESTFPGMSPFNDPNADGLVKTVYGLGASVELYNGTVYVTKHRRDTSVRVVPNDHPASYGEVEGFARIVVRRMP
jgi:hypothetical protein